MTSQDANATKWGKRVMKGGDWVDPDTPKKARRDDQVFSIRATRAEVEEFDAQLETIGMKRSQALRIAMRRIAGFVEVDPTVAQELRDATKQISGIAKNVNQIARAANRTHDPDYVGFMEERRALGKELSRVEAQMQRILNLAARRHDGLERLKKVAQE